MYVKKYVLPEQIPPLILAMGQRPQFGRNSARHSYCFFNAAGQIRASQNPIRASSSMCKLMPLSLKKAADEALVGFAAGNLGGVRGAGHLEIH
jgi:hypothetical protein